jgi:hypothetical protein
MKNMLWLEDCVYGILSFYWLAQINLLKNLPNSSTNRILKPMREFAILHTILQAKQNQSFNFTIDRIE